MTHPNAPGITYMKITGKASKYDPIIQVSAKEYAKANELLEEARKLLIVETNWAKHDCKNMCDSKGQEILYKLNEYLKGV